MDEVRSAMFRKGRGRVSCIFAKLVEGNEQKLTMIIESSRYVYSVCIFGNAHQKSNRDGANTSLG
jgi:hypothetical protein